MSQSLAGVAVVTGSSSGIGLAVAGALAARGMSLCLTGRSADRLQAAARRIAELGKSAIVHPADLAVDEEIRGLVERVRSDLRRIDVLVHAAGNLRLGNFEVAGPEDLDEQYRVNLRAPFLLTREFLPLLKESRGQEVFVNSSAAFAAGADNGLYAAMKAGLHILAGAIRDHVNPFGIRVLSVFPGRTATPMQEAVHRFEGRTYRGSDLLQPEDVAEAIAGSLALPRTAEVTEIRIRPLTKAATAPR